MGGHAAHLRTGESAANRSELGVGGALGTNRRRRNEAVQDELTASANSRSNRSSALREYADPALLVELSTLDVENDRTAIGLGSSDGDVMGDMSKRDMVASGTSGRIGVAKSRAGCYIYGGDEKGNTLVRRRRGLSVVGCATLSLDSGKRDDFRFISDITTSANIWGRWMAQRDWERHDSADRETERWTEGVSRWRSGRLVCVCQDWACRSFRALDLFDAPKASSARRFLSYP